MRVFFFYFETTIQNSLNTITFLKFLNNSYLILINVKIYLNLMELFPDFFFGV